MLYACVCYSSLFKCITKYRLYKQIEPLHSTGVPKRTPGYATANIMHWSRKAELHTYSTKMHHLEKFEYILPEQYMSWGLKLCSRQTFLKMLS